MASCSLGASNIKFLDAASVRPKNGVLGQRVGRLRTSTVWKLSHRVNLAISRPLETPVTVLCRASSDSDVATKNDSSEVTTSSFTSELIPNSYEVESLLTAICDTTTIAEFELKLAGFQLSVTRNLSEKNTTLPPPSPAPGQTQTISEASDSNGTVTKSSLAVYEPSKSSGSIQSLLDKASDEGLAILRSPRVGFFRRCRTIKGKRAPPSCKEKQIVKEGQIICFIEQLGGEIPIESETSGEVIKILREDGDAVGYGDALIAILPSFPGIKKLQ